MIKDLCGINNVGGFCPFSRRPDDPLCLDHASASGHGLAFVALDGRRTGASSAETLRKYQAALGRLRAAGASLPAHVDGS